MMSFQDIVMTLERFWAEKGCVIFEGYDIQVGAGTFNPATFFRVLGDKPWRVAYVEPSRRPTDGRYGENPNRLQHYYQFQVILKPAPFDVQRLYLESLEALGINLKEHDIRFVEDDWESPTLGAWGLGWEVWLDFMEITQFTYFQQMGGIDLKVIPCEITYGLERIAMYIQGKDNIFDIVWHNSTKYGDIHLKDEQQFSKYNFELADVSLYKNLFDNAEKEALKLLDEGLYLPAYDMVLTCSHSFNMLDARGSISVQERKKYILRIRKLAFLCAKKYLEDMESENE
jgi:glycyl-tRNA synthetase alpha chain